MTPWYHQARDEVDAGAKTQPPGPLLVAGFTGRYKGRVWIFGYGSLVWRPGFRFEEAHPARLEGFKRRFWQGSPDHRGTAERPGRVVTLLEDASSCVFGRAFRLQPHVFAESLSLLDHREKGGYERRSVELALLDEERRVTATLYVAGRDNPSYLGPADFDEMIRHIATSVGPSGRNDEYLLELACWLDTHGLDDPHVRRLAEGLLAWRERHEAEGAC
ncbi:MAG: gamma-glutamylcyclotransferase [Deltaproteobacteria bacterium]|jgi:cation transport regulator ChaC|nr:gamma-glutamylcyclotransferase [Deltaproteobacteria bacterium]MBW2534051.1 gamma-glutamylcyclotransferase [Deltaproteobacteria bacterium]